MPLLDPSSPWFTAGVSQPDDDMGAAAAASNGWTPPADTSPIPPINVQAMLPAPQFDQTLPPTTLSLPPPPPPQQYAPVFQGGATASQGVQAAPGVAPVNPTSIDAASPPAQSMVPPVPSFLDRFKAALPGVLGSPMISATGTGIGMTQNPDQTALQGLGGLNTLLNTSIPIRSPMGGGAGPTFHATPNEVMQLPGTGLQQIPGEQSVPGHGALEQAANLAVPAFLTGGLSAGARAGLIGAAGYYGGKGDQALGLPQLPVIGGPLQAAAMILAAKAPDVATSTASRFAEGLSNTGAGVVPSGVQRTIADAAPLTGTRVPRGISPTEGEGIMNTGGASVKKGANEPAGPTPEGAKSKGAALTGGGVEPAPPSMADALAQSLANRDAVLARAAAVRSGSIAEADQAGLPTPAPAAGKRPYVEQAPVPTVADKLPAAKSVDELKAQIGGIATGEVPGVAKPQTGWPDLQAAAQKERQAAINETGTITQQEQWAQEAARLRAYDLPPKPESVHVPYPTAVGKEPPQAWPDLVKAAQAEWDAAVAERGTVGQQQAALSEAAQGRVNAGPGQPGFEPDINNIRGPNVATVTSGQPNPFAGRQPVGSAPPPFNPPTRIGGYRPEEAPPPPPSGRGFLQNVAGSLGRNVNDAIGGAQTAMTSISPPLLRQGKIRLVTNPVAAVKEFGSSIKAMVSDGNADKIMQAALDQPFSSPRGSELSKTGGARFRAEGPGSNPVSGYTFTENGGYIRKWGPDAGNVREPGFEGIGSSDSLVSKVSQKLAGPSERQASVEMNLHALNDYNEAAQRMWDAGIRDKAQYRDLATEVNRSYQIGSISGSSLKIGPVQTPVFFSARGISGRAQFLGRAINALATDPLGSAKAVLTQSPVGAKQEAARKLVNLIGVNMAVMGTVSAAGFGTINWYNGIPTLQIGPNKINPWAGWGTQVGLAIGIAKNIEASNGDPDQFAKLTGDDLARFVRGQQAPYAGVATSALTGKDYAGNPYSISKEIRSGKILKDLYTPLNIAAIKEAWDNDGARGVAISGPLSTLSEGVNSATSPAYRRNEAQDSWAKTQGAGSWNELTQAQKNQAPAAITDLQTAARAASAARGDPISKATVQNHLDRYNAEWDSGGARSIDVKVAAGTMAGPDARAAYDELSKNLAIAANARFADPEVQAEIKKLDTKGDLTPADQAQKDYYAIFDQSGVKDGQGNLDFNNYQKALDDWQTKYPNYSKEDVSPAKPLSPGMAELQDARKQLRPYFDLQDQQWAAAQKSNPDLSRYRSVDEFITGETARRKALGQSDFVASTVAQALSQIYTAQSDIEQMKYLLQHRELLPLLDKWYSVPAELKPLVPGYVDQFIPANAR